MEDVVMFSNVYAGRRVFVTGHTGFKGAWLTLWLLDLGAHVTGYSLEPPTEPSLFSALRLADGAVEAHEAGKAAGAPRGCFTDLRGDVRDPERLRAALDEATPEIVFHLAAQALVRPGYADPHLTYETNVMGTVNLLEAARACRSVRAVLVVTSDKCYENREGGRAFREGDPLGGRDPYSSSKGCAELVAAAYAASFEAPPVIASVRAGNVIGGGDWAPDRIVPDCVRAVRAGAPIVVRNPSAVRPWQHVLEPLSGYLWLAAELNADGGSDHAGAWNFGPGEADGAREVSWVVDRFLEEWGTGRWTTPDAAEAAPYEARLLMLDTSKAARELDWQPVWSAAQAVQRTASWYRGYYHAVAESATDRAIVEECRRLALDQLHAYEADALSAGLAWARGGPRGEATHGG